MNELHNIRHSIVPPTETIHQLHSTSSGYRGNAHDVDVTKNQQTVAEMSPSRNYRLTVADICVLALVTFITSLTAFAVFLMGAKGAAFLIVALAVVWVVTAIVMVARA